MLFHFHLNSVKFSFNKSDPDPVKMDQFATTTIDNFFLYFFLMVIYCTLFWTILHYRFLKIPKIFIFYPHLLYLSSKKSTRVIYSSYWTSPHIFKGFLGEKFPGILGNFTLGRDSVYSQYCWSPLIIYYLFPAQRFTTRELIKDFTSIQR